MRHNPSRHVPEYRNVFTIAALCTLFIFSPRLSPAQAQDAPAPTYDAPSDNTPFIVPLVDEPPTPTPREVVANTTLLLYDLVLAHEGDCASLAVKLDAFIDTHSAEVKDASQAIADAATSMSPEDITTLGTFFDERITKDPRTAAAQSVLYPCLRTIAGQTRHQRVDRKMQRFFGLHDAMLLAIVGNVD